MISLIKLFKAIKETWHLPNHHCQDCGKAIGHIRTEDKYCLECERKHF